jgi:flavin reductase (DIM6/NTAB) family NADH-FMN oxidoreductase RutF
MDDFVRLVADLDYPMVIVTAGRSGCLVGFSTQVSIDPPRYLACISKTNHTHREAARTDLLAVHVLDDDDRHLAEVFGELTGDAVDKLSLVEWHEGPGGIPILAGTAGWFACRVVTRVDLGDHTGHVLEVVAAEHRRPVHQLGYQAVKGMRPGHDP